MFLVGRGLMSTAAPHRHRWSSSPLLIATSGPHRHQKKILDSISWRGWTPTLKFCVSTHWTPPYKEQLKLEQKLTRGSNGRALPQKTVTSDDYLASKMQQSLKWLGIWSHLDDTRTWQKLIFIAEWLFLAGRGLVSTADPHRHRWSSSPPLVLIATSHRHRWSSSPPEKNIGLYVMEGLDSNLEILCQYSPDPSLQGTIKTRTKTHQGIKW